MITHCLVAASFPNEMKHLVLACKLQQTSITAQLCKPERTNTTACWRWWCDYPAALTWPAFNLSTASCVSRPTQSGAKPTNL